MDYINKEAFKRKLIDEKSFFPAIVARALEEMPTADVVEVVRCKDCKYREDLTDRLSNVRVFCTLAVDNKEVDLTDFCSYGERRDT